MSMTNYFLHGAALFLTIAATVAPSAHAAGGTSEAKITGTQ